MAQDKIFDSGFLKKLEQLEIHTRYIHTTLYESGLKGTWREGEVEFSDYKPYTPGDDIRYIDWNVYGRLGSFVSKVFSAEEKKKTFIILDTSSSMLYRNKRAAACRLAASLAAVGLMGGDAVDIASVSDKIKSWSGEIQGKAGIYSVLEFLENCEFGGKTDLLRICRETAFSKQGPCRIILISDFWCEQNPAEYLALINGADKETSCVHLCSKEEVAPSMRGRFVLKCFETGKEVSVVISEHEADLYLEEMKKRVKALEQTCSRSRTDYVMVYDSSPVEHVLFEQFREAGILSQRLM